MEVSCFVRLQPAQHLARFTVSDRAFRRYRKRFERFVASAGLRPLGHQLRALNISLALPLVIARSAATESALNASSRAPDCDPSATNFARSTSRSLYR